MDHRDHVNLLRGGVQTPAGLWADFGSGAGAFTLALAELLGDGAQIISIDKDAGALRAQERVATPMPGFTPAGAALQRALEADAIARPSANASWKRWPRAKYGKGALAI